MPFLCIVDLCEITIGVYMIVRPVDRIEVLACNNENTGARRYPLKGLVEEGNFRVTREGYKGRGREIYSFFPESAMALLADPSTMVTLLFSSSSPSSSS